MNITELEQDSWEMALAAHNFLHHIVWDIDRVAPQTDTDALEEVMYQTFYYLEDNYLPDDLRARLL